MVLLMLTVFFQRELYSPLSTLQELSLVPRINLFHQIEKSHQNHQLHVDSQRQKGAQINTLTTLKLMSVFSRMVSSSFPSSKIIVKIVKSQLFDKLNYLSLGI